MKKIYVSFFGLKFLKIKKISPEIISVYLLNFIPFIYIKKVDNNYKINLACLYVLCEFLIRMYYFCSKYLIKTYYFYSKYLIKLKFKCHKKVTLCLMVCRPGTWCFDNLYRLLIKDGRFKVVIFVMPDQRIAESLRLSYLEMTCKELLEKGYNPVRGLDSNNTYFDLKKIINPDIIFYTDFWKPHFYKYFYINNFSNKINVLVEYGYSVMQDEKTCSFELNNLVDIYFRPTSRHLEMAKKLMKNHGSNIHVVGSPKLDPLFDNNYNPITSMWKRGYSLKRVIWSPHHSYNLPKNMYRNDAFWELYNFMLDLSKKYINKVQFVFRPHPLLREAIIKKWGEQKQKEYYSRWNSGENTSYYDGNFIDLFMTSDAMITDCCSFRAEYTAFNKPLFLTNTRTSREFYNDFGEEINSVLYHSTNSLQEDIIKFIEDVVLKDNDSFKQERTLIVNKYFSKLNGLSSSENIYTNLINYLTEV